MEMQKSQLRTRVRCCDHWPNREGFGDLHMSIPAEIFRRPEEGGSYTLHCAGVVMADGEKVACLCPGKSDKFGLTYIYCPECDVQIQMGTGDELVHAEGCPLSHVTFKGHHQWKNAYKSEKECSNPSEYMAQLDVLPEGVG